MLIRAWRVDAGSSHVPTRAWRTRSSGLLELGGLDQAALRKLARRFRAADPFRPLCEWTIHEHNPARQNESTPFGRHSATGPRGVVSHDAVGWSAWPGDSWASLYAAIRRNSSYTSGRSSSAAWRSPLRTASRMRVTSFTAAIVQTPQVEVQTPRSHEAESA